VDHIEKVNITGVQWDQLRKAEKALKALTIAAGELAQGVAGLPSKEFKKLKAQHLLLQEVLSQINKDRLV
jgi:hypothetical protein